MEGSKITGKKNNCYLLAVSFDFWEIHCIFVKK